MGQTYRLKTSTLVIQNNTDGKAVSVVVPAGAILETISEAGSLTTCAWEGGEVQVFSFDLQERGVLVRRGSQEVSLPKAAAEPHPTDS